MKRQLIAVYGPAGSGKTAFAESLMRTPEVRQSVSPLPKSRNGSPNIILLNDAARTTIPSIKRYRQSACWDIVIVCSNRAGLLEAAGLKPTRVYHCEILKTRGP